MGWVLFDVIALVAIGLWGLWAFDHLKSLIKGVSSDLGDVEAKFDNLLAPKSVAKSSAASSAPPATPASK